MLKAFIERLIRQQEIATGESADFMRDIYGAAPGGFWRFVLFVPMSRFRPTLPLDAYCAVRIAAVHAEDCGPCLQTVINLLLAAGATPQVLRAAVAGDLAAMDERTRTAFEFARAIAARDIHADDLRPVIERWWGKAGITEIALAVASTRVFPTVKRAMGYAQSCQRVVIEGEETNARRREAAAA
ncbi:conserved hypothetical protein [Parvibaculum lavamentivorans DS-1]|uniref:Carboxymuconolactone decarboxylase-like domain-containing protein n=1 Tax=Parvibaculum lavamentivorans (strain DS-1 / DSM 13023 / NCIMB 13966) TaxID=402881 RepID=A7HTV8_PARL1|nr:hypothetical protein [Parvibaculum lavamentivorans]ABS63341.1 conserved hypothetical protein [Parvibaculum lavamentivorans DS-1]